MGIIKISGTPAIFRKKVSSNEKKVSNNPFLSNPFGLSFKGKVQSGDLFVKSSSEGLKTSIMQKGKLAVSAAVASLVEIKNTFTQKLEPIVNFSKQTKAQIAKIADKVSNFELERFKISAFVKDAPHPKISKEARQLVTKPVTELATMWETAVGIA